MKILGLVTVILLYSIITPFQFIAIWMHHDFKEACRSVVWNWKEVLSSR